MASVEYAAGLIDGEGFIGISHTQADTYNIRVAVAMVTKGSPILDRMHRAFGGHVSEMKPESERNAAKTRWTVDGAAAAAFLDRVEPHLILKGEQARTALRMWADLEASRASGGRKHWTPELRDRCEVAKRKMHDLNARGPVAQTPQRPDETPVAIYRWGAWWEPEDDLFGPVEFQGKWPTCGRMISGHVYASPSWQERMPQTSSSPLLQTPVASEGLKPSNTMGVARRQATGQVFLTNQIVTLCGLDPSED